MKKSILILAGSFIFGSIALAGTCNHELVQVSKDNVVLNRSGLVFPTAASFDNTETLEGCVKASLTFLNMDRILSYSEDAKLREANPQKREELLKSGGISVIPDEQKAKLLVMNAVEYSFTDKSANIQASGTIVNTAKPTKP